MKNLNERDRVCANAMQFYMVYLFVSVYGIYHE